MPAKVGPGPADAPRLSARSGTKDVAAPLFSKRREKYSIMDWAVGTGIGQVTAIFLVGSTILTLGMFLYKTAAWMAAGEAPSHTMDYRLALWTSWTMFTDPGTQTGVESGDWREQSVAVLVSLTGYVFFLCVMGIVVDLVRKTLDDWKTFHARVVANDHTLILGWSTKTLYLLQQLAQGQMDRQQGDPSVPDRDVVVMADVDDDRCVELQREVAGFFRGKNDGLNVTVCTGSSTACPDLLRASVRTAEQIVVMSPDPAWLSVEDGGATAFHDERADQYVLSVVLALTSIATNLQTNGEVTAASAKTASKFGGALPEEPGIQGAVIAEVKRPETLGWIYHVTTDLQDEDGDGISDAPPSVLLQADALLADMLMKQLLIRHAFDPVVGSVLEELLGYEGQDLYFSDFDGALAGRTFGEARCAVEDAVCLGIMESAHSPGAAAASAVAAASKNAAGGGGGGERHTGVSQEPGAGRGHEVLMNPPDERRMCRGEKLLYIAEAQLSADDTAPMGKETKARPPALASANAAAMAAPASSKVVDLDAAASDATAGAAMSPSLFKKGDSTPSTVLLFGWQTGSAMQELLGLIDQEVAPGSSVHIMSEVTVEERKVRHEARVKKIDRQEHRRPLLQLLLPARPLQC
jgi:hypothetical protein